MKKITLLLLLLLSLTTFAQVYPFAEGFDGMPGNQPPIGWGGSMKVLLNHGVNDLKGLSGRVSSAVTKDSSITPLIGPLTASSAISFRYRIIDQANYPSTPTNLVTGDEFILLISSDSVNYQTILQIDENNHNPNFNFLTKKIYLSQFAGQSVQFKFLCKYATGASFFVDIDTVQVFNDPQAAIEILNNNTAAFTIYPNPASANNSLIQINTNNAFIGLPYKICTVNGQELIGGTITATTFQLPCNNFAAGLYFVQLGNLTRKLIIE